jgi:hypothetical protein
MNDTMAIIYITQTGHVIGAVTCNSDPKRTLTPADVAGPDSASTGIVLTPSATVPIPAGFFLNEFTVPVSVLTVTPPVAFNEAVFQAPGAFAVSNGVAEQLPIALPGTWKVKLYQTYLEIDFPASANASSDVPVWAQIQDPNPPSLPPDTRVLAGKITQGSISPTKLPLTILPGGAAASLPGIRHYSIAVMIGGYLPFFDQSPAS